MATNDVFSSRGSGLLATTIIRIKPLSEIFWYCTGTHEHEFTHVALVELDVDESRLCPRYRVVMTTRDQAWDWLQPTGLTTQ
jgi:hypothetical protein